MQILLLQVYYSRMEAYLLFIKQWKKKESEPEPEKRNASRTMGFRQVDANISRCRHSSGNYSIFSRGGLTSVSLLPHIPQKPYNTKKIPEASLQILNIPGSFINCNFDLNPTIIAPYFYTSLFVSFVFIADIALEPESLKQVFTKFLPQAIDSSEEREHGDDGATTYTLEDCFQLMSGQPAFKPWPPLNVDFNYASVDRVLQSCHLSKHAIVRTCAEKVSSFQCKKKT